MWGSTQYLVLGIMAAAAVALWFFLTSDTSRWKKKGKWSTQTPEQQNETPQVAPSSVISKHWNSDTDRQPTRTQSLKTFAARLVIGMVLVFALGGAWIVNLIALVRAGGVESVPIIGFLLATTAFLAAISILWAHLSSRNTKK